MNDVIGAHASNRHEHESIQQLPNVNHIHIWFVGLRDEMRTHAIDILYQC